MAQVNMNAWQQGSQMYRDSLDRERQAQQDAMQAKRFGWEEEKVNRERSAYDETQRIGGETRRMLEEEAAPAQMFGDNGFTGMREAPDAAYGPPAMAANPVANNPTTSDAANPVANNLAQGLQEGLGRLGKQRQMLLSVYDMARANNDRQTMAAVTGQIQTLNTATQRANIFNQVYSNPEMAAGIAANLTRNPAIPLKAQTDASGVTTLVRDDGSSAGKLTPDQMAMVAVHMWDMRSGDIEGGRKGLASINKELADAVTAQNSAVNVEATSANAGLKLGSELKTARAQQEQYGANTARIRATSGQEKLSPEDRRLQFLQENGVPVTPELVKEIANVARGGDGGMKFAQQAALKALENGAIKPEELPAHVTKIHRAMQTLGKASDLEAVIVGEVANGRGAAARKEWVAKGGNPAQFDAIAQKAQASRQPAAAGVTSEGERTVSRALQTRRDADARVMIEAELASAQRRLQDGDPRAHGDIAALNKELARLGAAPQPVAPPVQTNAAPTPAPGSRIPPSNPGAPRPAQADPATTDPVLRPLLQARAQAADGSIAARTLDAQILARQRGLEPGAIRGAIDFGRGAFGPGRPGAPVMR